MATIKWETADNMMNIVAFVAMRAGIEQGEQVNLEGIKEFARDMFQEYCEVVGITEVEDPDEENVEDFDEECSEDEDSAKDYFGIDDEENDNDGVVYSLTVKGEFVMRCMEEGYTFEKACEMADLLFGDGE